MAEKKKDYSMLDRLILVCVDRQGVARPEYDRDCVAEASRILGGKDKTSITSVSVIVRRMQALRRKKQIYFERTPQHPRGVWRLGEAAQVERDMFALDVSSGSASTGTEEGSAEMPAVPLVAARQLVQGVR